MSVTDLNKPLLQVRGLCTQLGPRARPVRAVDGIDLDLMAARTFALVGESGCGKSMTALSLLGLLPGNGRVVGGSAMFAGQDLLTLDDKAMRRVRGRRIAMIFQEPQSALNPVLTVGDQIAEVLRRHLRLRGKPLRERLLQLLDQVGIPDPARRLGDYPHQFSGGMKQRIMIAIALACEPDLLIADEPTTALDVTIQAQVLDLLRRLQRESGMAMLLITHDLGVVRQVADRVAVMYAGQLVEQADSSEFFSRPAHPYSRKLFAALPSSTQRGQPLETISGNVPPLDQPFSGCRFHGRCSRAWAHCAEVEPGWLQTAPGHGVRCHQYDPQLQSPGEAAAGHRPVAVLEQARRPEATSLLSVRGLQVYFPLRKGLLQRVHGHVRAVDGVDLALDVGQTLALVGESGCGKTTTGKAILRLIEPTAGQVLFNGDNLADLSPSTLRRRRREFQIIFQDPYASMNPRMRIADIIDEGMAAQGVGGGRAQRRQRVSELLQQVGIDPAAGKRFPHEFSGGQRQRICVARALAVEPRLIICDEPTSALDVSVQAQIINLLKDLQQQLGIAYLFITHNISAVEYLAHRVAVMYLGRIVEWGSAAQVLERPRHPYTQALLSVVPRVEPDGREVIHLQGDLPSPLNPPSGCPFHPRCPRAEARCESEMPGVSEQPGGHSVRCFLPGTPEPG